MAKEFKYRGKTLDELKNMNFNELLGLLPARARRSLKRGFTDQQKILLKRIRAFNSGKRKKQIKTHCRDMIVLPEMVGMLILVHIGNKFTPVNITEDMIGLYLGELTLTRQKVVHSAPGIGATKSSSAVSVR